MYRFGYILQICFLMIFQILEVAEAGECLIRLHEPISLGAPPLVYGNGPRGHLVGGETGLFEIKENGEVKRIYGGYWDEENVRAIFIDGPDGPLVGGRNGLYQIEIYGASNSTFLKRIPGDDPGEVISIRSDSTGNILVEGKSPWAPPTAWGKSLFWLTDNSGKSLFKLTERGLKRVPGRWSGWAGTIQQNSPQGLLVGGEEGLFVMTDQGLIPVAGEGIGSVKAIGHDLKGNVLVGGGNGLFQFKENWLSQVHGADFGEVYTIFEHKDETLVGGKEGLFRITHNGIERVSGEFPGSVRVIKEDKWGELLIGAENGAFRITEKSLIKLPMKTVPGGIWNIYQGPSGDPLFLTQQGLFEIIKISLKNLTIDNLLLLPKNLGFKQPVPIEWTLGGMGLCAEVDEFTNQYIKQWVFLSKPKSRGNSIPFSVHKFKGANFGTTIPGNHFEEEGEYLFVLNINDPLSGTHKINLAKSEIKPGGFEGFIQRLVPAVSILGILHFLFFIGLVLGAKKNRWCFEILTDPSWNLGKVYFRPAVKYLPFIRQRILSRYFDLKKREVENRELTHSYLPVELEDNAGRKVSSDNILMQIGKQPQIWLQGEAGTGKTSLTQALEETYFKERNLNTALRKYKFLPIFIKVRDFPGVPDSVADPWVTEMARFVMQSTNFPFRDSSFFQEFIESGDFALIIDGLNEEDRDPAVQRYINKVGSGTLRILITSQNAPLSWKIPTFVLPIASDPFIKRLLAVLLGGEKQGEEVYNRLTPSLKDAIRSGYDIELIAEICRSGLSLPNDRNGLYKEIFFNALPSKQAIDLDYEFSQMAWQKFLSGVRRFEPDTTWTNEKLSIMEASHLLVKRGKAFEFRHDLMRAYIAARLPGIHVHKIQKTIELMNDKAFWGAGSSKVKPSDREEMMRFIVDMLGNYEDILEIRKFAELEIKSRGFLWQLAKEKAKREGWYWQ